MQRRTKIAVVAGVIAIAALAVLAATSGSVRDALTNIGSGFSGAFSSLTGGPGHVSSEINLVKNISLSADLGFTGPLRLVVPADTLTVRFVHAGTVWQVGGEKLNFVSGANITLELDNFNGELTVDRTLTLTGTADALYVNSVVVLPNMTSMSVSVSGLEFDDAQLSGAALSSFDSDDMTGALAAGGNKVRVVLDNDSLSVRPFVGDIGLTGSTMALDGFTDSISVAGQLLVDVR